MAIVGEPSTELSVQIPRLRPSRDVRRGPVPRKAREPARRHELRGLWYRGYVHQLVAFAFLMIGLGDPAHGHSLEGQMAWQSLVRAG